MRVLVLGASGMLGHAMISILSENRKWEVFGTVRSLNMKKFFKDEIAKRLRVDIDVENHYVLTKLFDEIQPHIVINCIGLVKQLPQHENPLLAFPINAILPHRLANLCSGVGARLVHISTDCVFSGEKGNYTEDDPSDARELYGKTKYLGEICYPHTITLRTSIIGRELNSSHGLVEWFLSQQEKVKGFKRAIFSGLPTIELAYIIQNIVIPQSELSGVYHVASKAISKFDLLHLLNNRYGKNIAIEADEELVIDRSLNSEKFKNATGYIAPSWPDLINKMAEFQ